MRPLVSTVLAALLAAGCGGASTVDQPVTDQSTGTGTGSPMTQPLEIRRTGGIAGFDDRLTVAPDGSAALVTRGLARRSCQLPAPLLERAGAIPWGTLPNAPEPTERSDAMRFVVTAGERTATLDADVPPPGQEHAVETAAALFAAVESCPPAP